MKILNLIILSLAFLISSCSSYVSKIYKQLDREEKVMGKNKRDVFDQYRKMVTTSSLKVPNIDQRNKKTKPY